MVMMGPRAGIAAFIRAREGKGLVTILLFAAALSVVAASGFYRASLASFIANKTDEKATAMQLVDAFVNYYSNLRADFHAGDVPVPATFRARGIEMFNQGRDERTALSVRASGREGRWIATPPSDPAVAQVIESFVGQKDPAPVSQFLSVDGKPVFRTVYPSIAREETCVNCHNSLQPGRDWKLNDVMGAFTIDAPAGPFLTQLRWECAVIAIVVLVLIGGVGTWMSVAYYRRSREREGAREEAEAASRSKSAFLANMSHELRTPLNAVIGFSEMMLREVMGEFRNEQYRAYTTDIHRSGTHLLQIINDILDLSKAEAGKLTLDEDLFDPRDVVKAVCQLTSVRMRDHGLSETIDLATDLPLLRGDERKTMQMLLNLVTNAIKFSNKGGRIEISGRAVPGGGIELTVADNGIGIEPKNVPRMLEAFEQVESSLNRQHQGTGLGLPLVKAMIESHGGELRIESALGVGTKATLVFPAERIVQPAEIGVAA
jgi:signal transduction histidine kinase